MTPSPNKPGVVFWATVVAVVALVAYPLSLGPACWISSRTNTGAGAVTTVYKPITWISDRSPDLLRNAVHWYSSVGAAHFWRWRLFMSGAGNDPPELRWSDDPH
jgi:hypothetical protein